jgi:hypothetical protein
MFDQAQLESMLGYLNFSEGRADARFQKSLNDLTAHLAAAGHAAPWFAARDALVGELEMLARSGKSAFKDVSQARAVIGLVFDQVVPSYRKHHADLLYHLQDADFYQAFFVARVFEATLAQRGPWEETERIVAGALKQLNDFLGHRPIAVLEGRQKGEPYDHERCRPIPLYIRGAGVAHGPYADIVARALDILEKTDPAILREAYFDPALLDELALDPRGYDFAHPVDKRSNYSFGEWDPHHLDNQARFRRFVVRSIILDGLIQRIAAAPELPAEELLNEAGAVLAGTMLMASGVSGSGPNTHDSSVTLSNLIQRIARYREQFYEALLQKWAGRHAERLKQEKKVTRQAFGGVRQFLNHHLGQQRALYMQRRHLALLFAELGYPAASRRLIASIPVAPVRMLTEMHIHLTTGQMLAKRGQLDKAAQELAQVEDLLKRGIHCGALVDPWNILGFQGQFPRFHALEDSIADTRVEDLTYVMDCLFNLYAQLMSEGAARGDFKPDKDLAKSMRKLASWWDYFATTTVSDIPHIQGAEATKSAEHVMTALTQWRERGSAMADLAFWRGHLDRFNSPKAFALVVDALLQKDDFRSAMSLLMTWLSQAEQVPLEEGDHSFYSLVMRWMLGLCPPRDRDRTAPGNVELVCKFFDFLEVNGEELWSVPVLDVAGLGKSEGGDHIEEAEAADEEDDDERSLFDAAYDEVTYRDSTDDDVEAEVLDYMPQADSDLLPEAERLEARLRFHSTLARLWNIATRVLRGAEDDERKRGQVALVVWLEQAARNTRDLLKLLDDIHGHTIPKASGSYESMVEYDERRLIKERLLSTVIMTCLDQMLAVGALRGALDGDLPEIGGDWPEWDPHIRSLERCLMKQQPEEAREALAVFIETFRKEPLLYTPIERGGNPRLILRASLAQTILRGLVSNLPRQGLLVETLDLIRLARQMEANQNLAGHRITEFDHLFHLAIYAVVESVTEAAIRDKIAPDVLVGVLEAMTKPFVEVWFEHSKTLHVSLFENVPSEKEWQLLVKFIKRYGNDLFTPRFMHIENLRGIAHQGVGAYLDYLKKEADPLKPMKLIEELNDGKLKQEDAENYLHFILQVLVDNYNHYQDYRLVTTQADYGENLYQLLEFLRLKANYERFGWDLKPLNMVHEVLARLHGEAAALWRKQAEAVTHEPSVEYLQELDELQKTYSMKLATIRDRLEERFIQPMVVDRFCALVEPAIEQAAEWMDRTDPSPLEIELEPFVNTPSGVGLDVPGWILRLEDEFDRVKASKTALMSLAENLFQVPKLDRSFEALKSQFPQDDEDDDEEAAATP